LKELGIIDEIPEEEKVPDDDDGNDWSGTENDESCILLGLPQVALHFD
jgi:hypothetical protein